MPKLIIDANIILRFLRADHPGHFAATKVDLMDCYVAANAAASGHAVCSFD